MLNGRIALVTGACGDIGAATVKALANQGALVTASDVRGSEVARAVLGGVIEAGNCVYLQADVTKRDEVRILTEETVARFGRLDICVANAAIVAPKPFLEITDEEWRSQLDVNLSGCFYTGQEAGRVMARGGTAGKIIFVSSWVQDIPSRNLTAYCVSKGGLKMLAKCMALELAPSGINVNLVAPGNVDAGLSAKMFERDPSLKEKCVRMTPLNYVMSAEQVAESIVFLCSAGAAYMTGATLLVDGGCSLFQRD